MSASSKSDVVMSVILTRPVISTSLLIISYTMVVITNVINARSSSKNVFMFNEVIVEDNHNTGMCIRDLEILLIRLG